MGVEQCTVNALDTAPRVRILSSRRSVVVAVLLAQGLRPAIAFALPSQAWPRTDASRVEAASAGAGVRLQVRPTVGDTLRLVVDQELEMRTRRGIAPSLGAAGEARRPTEPLYGPRADGAVVRRTQVRLWAHSLVERADLSSTTLLATTDSISTWSGAPGEAVRLQAMPMPTDGRQVRVLVSPDGAMRVADPPPGAMELSSSLSSIPGLLPAGPVKVGTTWRRDMPLPSLPVSGYQADGVVQARLRLDSLTQRGRIAWISLEGELRRDGAARDLPVGTRVITAGTIRGALCVDRQRAWIVEASTTIDVTSEVVTGPAATAPPTILSLRLKQQLRVK